MKHPPHIFAADLTTKRKMNTKFQIDGCCWSLTDCIDYQDFSARANSKDDFDDDDFDDDDDDDD